VLQHRWHQWLDNLGLRLSGIDALPQLAMLAIPVGLLSGGVIILFRLLVESSQGLFLSSGGEENYEALTTLTRLLLPALGGLLIGLIWQFLRSETRQVGVVHVMERLANHQGRLPWRNALAQFFGAALSIISGHSVGREGPSVHLGATSGSQLGQWLHLPNNSNRTLAACGIAAAIAASFNTPLAGVIFSMEVVMMEYSLVSFAPVILAAVTATTLTQAVFGDNPVFVIPNTQLGSLLELPYILLTGVVLGCLAALFIHLLQHTSRLTTKWPVWLRCTLGGSAVGLIATVSPEVMGIGYDTVNQALLGQLGLALLAGVCLAKILATAIGLGLGLPGGLIGPTLVMGAMAGGAMGLFADSTLPGEVATPAFYALIGMGTFMGATLQAPLAALTAMLELTANPHIILPGMLALIAASLVSRELFGKDSVYLVLMKARGLDYRDTPLTRALQRMGVANVMERRVETLARHIGHEQAVAALSGEPHWLLISENSTPTSIMPAADLARYLEAADSNEHIDLMEIPATRGEIRPIDFQATLQEAMELLTRNEIEALYVTRTTIPGISRIYGVLTRKEIELSYRI
jgi:CIC family chloride channel protein